MADGLWRIWSIGSSRDQRILFTNTMSMKVKNAASHRPEFAKLVEPFKPEATEPGTSQRSGILFSLTCHTRVRPSDWLVGKNTLVLETWAGTRSLRRQIQVVELEPPNCSNQRMEYVVDLPKELNARTVPLILKNLKEQNATVYTIDMENVRMVTTLLRSPTTNVAMSY